MINREDKVLSSCIAYIPDVYADIEEFKELARVYDMELNRIYESAETVFGNFNDDTLNEEGCTKWERILKIRTNSSYSVEDRRFAIKLKKMGTSPYTKIRLKELLTAIAGEGNFKLVADYKKKHLTCFIDLSAKNQRTAVIDMLEHVLQVDWTFNVGLLFNTHKILSGYTHKELSKYTHEQLREEKMSND